jgi:hypothetical protein
LLANARSPAVDLLLGPKARSKLGKIRSLSMSIERIGLSVFGAIAVMGAVIALATAWLFLTNPVTVANAVNEGDITPFVRDLAQVLLTALEGLLKYL